MGKPIAFKRKNRLGRQPHEAKVRKELMQEAGDNNAIARRAKRMVEIDELLATGVKEERILEWGAARYGVGQQTIRNDVNTIKKRWIRAELASISERKAQARAAYGRALVMAFEQKKPDLVRRIVDSICKLDNLHSTTLAITPGGPDDGQAPGMDVKLELRAMIKRIASGEQPLDQPMIDVESKE